MKPWQMQALTELRAERDRIDAAIRAIESLGSNGSAPETNAPARETTARPTEALTELDDEILSALQNGKTTTTELVKTSRSSAYVVKKSLKRLIAAGRVTTSGATNTLRYHPA